MPSTVRAIQIRATKNGWQSRPRSGRGGGKEYHYTSFSEQTRVHLAKAAAHVHLVPQGKEAQAGAEAGRRLAQAEAEAKEKARIAKEKGLAAFNQLPAGRRREAEARFDLLKMRDTFIAAAGLPIKRGSKIFCAEVMAGRIELEGRIVKSISRKGKISLSWSSLNRWQQAFDEYGLVGLAGKYVSRKGETSVPEHMQEFLLGLKVEKPHLEDTTVYMALQARFDGMHLPHRASVRRFMRNWEQENESLLLFITNPDEWRNKHMFAFGSAAEDVHSLNQVWEFDSTPADVMLTDGRHCLIGVIDVYSRRLKLLVSPTSKATAVAALNRRAIIDWGVPEIAKTDNGADYVSHHMVRVFSSLGIYQELCPPFTPEHKPHIERAFKTYAHSFVELMPGYIGHNVADRKAIEARRSFAQRLMNKESDPIEINMTAAELQSFCDRWVEAIYHQNVHAGLGCSPYEKARSWQEPVRRITDERTLDILLAEAPSNNGKRIMGKKGINVGNAKFIPEEPPETGTEVRVLEDKTDFGTIYLFALETGKFISLAHDPVRKGMNRAEVAAKGKAAQKKAMQEGRKVLKKMGREARVDAIHEEILAYRENKRRNIVDLPQASEEYTTPAIEEAAKAVRALDGLRDIYTDDDLEAAADRALARLAVEAKQPMHAPSNSTLGEEQDLDILLAKIEEEKRAEEAERQKLEGAGVTPLFGSKTERYDWIYTRPRKDKRLTEEEAEFLEEFYSNKTAGKSFFHAHGDLRKKWGVRPAKKDSDKK